MTLRGAILSVGGSTAPLIQALTRRPVESALFIVSERSESQVAAEVLPKLGYALQWECLLLNEPDDLNSCYRQIRAEVPAWLSRRRLAAEETYFDLTGGTKPMSAALTLAAVEWIPHYHYVSGEREKGGLGNVISGTERSAEGPNPWLCTGLRQREAATQLYAEGHVEAAAALLEKAASTAAEQTETLKAFARFCHLLAKVDLFLFRGAANELGQCCRMLEVALELRGEAEALTRLKRLREHWTALETEYRTGKFHPRCLLELLANAQRRRRQGRFDDAVARLYRAVELFAQNRLHEAFGAESGRIALDRMDAGLAATLRAEFPDSVIEGNRLQLSCAKGFQALAHSPQVEDRRLTESYQRLKPALEKRNQSWLAHGTRPAEPADFDQMWNAVLKEFNIGAADIPQWPELRF